MAELDYYAVLGVLPDAEDVVIAAAYRALAKRYHPDQWKSDPLTAHKRMTEINTANAILGDTSRRADYDKTRAKCQPTLSGYDNPDQAEAFQSALNDVDAKWETACSIYPDLMNLRSELAKISTQQAFAFVTVLLETKDFKRREEIAAHLERVYLERYFGTNEHILDYAKHLVRNDHKEAVQLLNHLVSVMGSDVDPVRLINHTETAFPYPDKYNLKDFLYAKVQEQSSFSYRARVVVGQPHQLRSHPDRACLCS